VPDCGAPDALAGALGETRPLPLCSALGEPLVLPPPPVDALPLGVETPLPVPPSCERVAGAALPLAPPLADAEASALALCASTLGELANELLGCVLLLTEEHGVARALMLALREAETQPDADAPAAGELLARGEPLALMAAEPLAAPNVELGGALSVAPFKPDALA